MADNRQRAERLAAALGCEVSIAPSDLPGRGFVVRISGSVARRLDTDANAWRWAAEHLAAKAAEIAGPLPALHAEAEAARVAYAAADDAASDAHAALRRAQAKRDEAWHRDNRAARKMLDAFGAATPEQRAAWDALREVGR